MTTQLSPRTTPASLLPAAHALADAFELRGDRLRAAKVLALAQHVEADDELVLRQAEGALAQGDAATALAALVPAWEAGSLDLRLEARLAFAAVAAGLDDVGMTLTEPPPATEAHGLLRLVLGTARGEIIDPKGLGALASGRMVWALRALLRELSHCGRADLVHAFAERCDALGVPGLRTAAAQGGGIAAPSGQHVSPPLATARPAFEALWPGPHGAIAFNWAWTVAREVGQDETTALLGAANEALAALLGHGRTFTIAAKAGTGAQLIADPEALPLRPGRLNHVVAAGWLEDSLAPVEALREMWRALRHGGQLHLLAAGPAASDIEGLRLSASALKRAAIRAGFIVDGVVGRDAQGVAAATPDQAVFHLLRAEKDARAYPA